MKNETFTRIQTLWIICLIVGGAATIVIAFIVGVENGWLGVGVLLLGALYLVLIRLGFELYIF